jgi:hypothetical protein
MGSGYGYANSCGDGYGGPGAIGSDDSEGG